MQRTEITRWPRMQTAHNFTSCTRESTVDVDAKVHIPQVSGQFAFHDCVKAVHSKSLHALVYATRIRRQDMHAYAIGA